MGSEFRSWVPKPGTLSGRPAPGWGMALPWPHGSSPPPGSWYLPTLGLLVLLCHLLLPTGCPSYHRAPDHTFQNEFWKHKSWQAQPCAGPLGQPSTVLAPNVCPVPDPTCLTPCSGGSGRSGCQLFAA